MLGINYDVSYLLKLMQKLKDSHYKATKEVLKYTCGKVEHGMEYKQNEHFIWHGTQMQTIQVL